MKGIAITTFGIEDICALEIEELTCGKAVKLKGCVEFEAESYEDLFKLAYSAQSASRIMLLLDHFKASNVEQIFDHASKTDFKEYVSDVNRVRIECQREGSHDFKSVNVESALLKNITERFKNIKLDMKNPEIIIYMYVVDDDCYLCIDMCGRDLSKREYKIFNNPYSIRPAIAYAIGRIADIDPGDVILDPFCGTGEITIEAALFLTRMSPNFYSKNNFAFRRMPLFREGDFDGLFKKVDSRQKDVKLKIHAFDHQMRNMTAAKKNAKIAGINKQIHIARVDTDWIELKLEEGSVDKIITRLPSIPKDEKAKTMMKVIDDFFYQAEFVMKKKGKIVAMMQKKEGIEEPMTKYGFSKIDEREVWQGKEKHHIVVIEK